MAHEITADDRVITVSAKGQKAWHGLDECLKEPPESALACKIAEWEPIVVPTYINLEGDEFIETGNCRAIIRPDTRKILGYCGKEGADGSGWKPLPNAKLAEITQRLIDTGLCDIETAGTLKGGEQIWYLLKMRNSEVEVLKNDPYERYLLASNGHDGKTAVRFGSSEVRVVCANTLQMAFSSKMSKLIRVRHTGELEMNVDKVVDLFNLQQMEFEADMEKMRWLATRPINQADLRRYVKTYLGVKEDEKVSTKMSNIIEKIMGSVYGSPGADLPEIQDTWYQAAHGLNYYVNYEKGRSQDARMYDIWFRNAGAAPFSLALDMANAA